jgi:thioesterase domain-containing protein
MTANAHGDAMPESKSERLEREFFALGTEPVAPASDTERRLTQIWEEVLGVDGLGVEDDFWLIGGDSLVIVTLLARIGESFGTPLPLAVMLDCPTVRRLGFHIERVLERLSLLLPPAPGGSSGGAEDACLVPIRADGDATPIFVIHGLQCDPTFALMLAKRLPRDQPVYGFRALGLDGHSAPLRTIEAFADRYLESLLRVQPRGPYILSGFCAGGHVAMEMAHRLTHAGRHVAQLFMIDTPVAVESRFIDLEVRLAEKALEAAPQLRSYLAGAPATVAAFGEALKAYRPKAYAGSGKAHILANREEAARMRDPAEGWPKYLPPGTALGIVAPTHKTIALDGMAAIARYIREQLLSSPYGAGPVKSTAPATR